jgi:hypothetical protein
MRDVVFGSNSRGACIQYVFAPSAAIERGCSIGANHAQNCRLTGSGLTTGVATAGFRQSEHVSTSALRLLFIGRASLNIVNAAPNLDHRRDRLRLPGSSQLA